MEARLNFARNLDSKWWDSACDEAKSKKYSLLRKFRTTIYDSPADFTLFKLNVMIALNIKSHDVN